MRFSLLLFIISILLTDVTHAQEDVAGSIKNILGEVVIVRNGIDHIAKPGTKIFQRDLIKTGPNSSVGIIFRDNSTLSMGSRATIVIDEFVFSPAKGALGMVIRFLKGTAVFLSGEITKLSPESVKFTTPLSTIGIRGTRFLVQTK